MGGTVGRSVGWSCALCRQTSASCSRRLVRVVPAGLLLWGGRIAGQVRRPLMQSYLFTKKIVSNLLQPALSHNKCSQYYFSKPIPSVLTQAMLVPFFFFRVSASEAFTLPMNWGGGGKQTRASVPCSASQHQWKHFTRNTNSGVTSNIFLSLGSCLSGFWLWAKLDGEGRIPPSNCRPLQSGCWCLH